MAFTGVNARYGSRARLGMMLPSGNVAAEPEVTAMLPEGVSLHTTRLKLTGSSDAQLMAMTQKVEEAGCLLADAAVDLILFHCTAVTTSAPGADTALLQRIEAKTGLRSTATSRGLLAAIRILEVRRLVLITPYINAINQREIAFLRSHGIEVVVDLGLGIDSPQEMIKVEPQEWLRLARTCSSGDAEAYFLSCTAIRSLEIIAALEAEFGKPVLTSNQVATWHALRLLGVQDVVPGAGRLFTRS